MKERLLFFDALRILSIFLIVIAHIGFPLQPILDWANTFDKFLTFYVSSGAIGVSLLVFVSGAVMQHAYANKNTIKGYGDFVIKRLERIYPAYWVTLLLASLLAPSLIQSGWSFFAQITGFMPSLTYFAWWIGLFISLSLVFPFVSQLVKKRPYQTLIGALIITLVSRIVISSLNGSIVPGFAYPVIGIDRVLFPCLLLEFTLGMFVVEKNIFSKTHINNHLAFVSDLSYYIFLSHVMLYINLRPADPTLFWQPKSIAYYILMVVLFSLLIKFFDEKVQQYLKLLRQKRLSRP